MQKALTIATLVLVCIAATSVAYYYGRYLTRVHDAEVAEQRRKIDLENAQKCNTDGRKFYSDFVKIHGLGTALPGWEITWDEPETHFISKRGTCVVHIRSVQSLAEPSRLRANTPSIHRNQVFDVYGNRAILQGWFERRPEGGERFIEALDPRVPNYTSGRYLAEKNKLFSE